MALPGGFLRDEAEPILAAAQRELGEEAGLDVDALTLEELGVYGQPLAAMLTAAAAKGARQLRQDQRTDPAAAG